MRRPPRSASEPLLTRFVAFRTVYLGVLMSAMAVVLFLVAAPLGVVGPDSTAQTQTLAVTAVASSRSSTSWPAGRCNGRPPVV